MNVESCDKGNVKQILDEMLLYEGPIDGDAPMPMIATHIETVRKEYRDHPLTKIQRRMLKERDDG